MPDEETVAAALDAGEDADDLDPETKVWADELVELLLVDLRRGQAPARETQDDASEAA